MDWQAVVGAFALVFVAELGDKTQLAVLSLASKSESPWLVFCGGALALVVVTGLGVVWGEGLTRLLSRRVLLGLAALAFVVMGVLMWVGVV